LSYSCDKVAWLEERKFWIFEGVTIGGSLISTLTVFLRQRVLDRRMLRRLQRQLASGAKVSQAYLQMKVIQCLEVLTCYLLHFPGQNGCPLH